jgi:hypothetical protein
MTTMPAQVIDDSHEASYLPLCPSTGVERTFDIVPRDCKPAPRRPRGFDGAEIICDGSR